MWPFRADQKRPDLRMKELNVEDVHDKSLYIGAGRGLDPQPSTLPTSRWIHESGYHERRCKATWIREFKLPWREAGPPNHRDDKVDSDQ